MATNIPYKSVYCKKCDVSFWIERKIYNKGKDIFCNVCKETNVTGEFNK
jgi:hypothetical protein